VPKEKLLEFWGSVVRKTRLKIHFGERMESVERERRVRVELESTVEAIEPERVRLQTRAGAQTLPNQAVIVCAGGVLPTAVLQKAGVQFETKYGAA
jgi:NADH dehydrogenase FAD-containing subunit